MKRIAHLVINLNHGGAEQLVVRWALQRLQQDAQSTYVITLDEPGALAEQLPQTNHYCLSAQRQRKPWDRTAMRRLRQFLKEKSIDVLHSHNLAAQQYAVLGTVGSAVAHVQTQHGANTHVLGMGNRLRSALLARLTGAVVAVSAGTRDSMAAQQFIPAQKIRLIPNGVAAYSQVDELEVARMRAQYGLDDCIVFGSVGRLAAVKGWARFLPEFAAFASQVHAVAGGKPAKLLLVGDGPERAAIEQQAKSLGIADLVVLAGFQTDPQPWLALMDVFLLPSLSEGLSVALLEALEGGLYACVTDVGDCGAVVREVGHGTVLVDEPSGWSQQLLEIYQARPPRRVAALSSSSAGRIYSQSHCLECYEDLYTSVAINP
ncbi:glycosyltransferase [Coraliomargarita algicola]|uniref:Glycosyltransferase n=1 Tax=Coraliomargarita algicola TaxID=3092156 RepID=A0ABZ0RNC5_9BACT|nr:glycosyltransferase [Coraliomargarita sp. J2-16]WPJ97721.1 glycosyltransferase [Coraliomargarita sp. J2-16]